MEHTSEVVADGKLLHESSYPQRAEKYREIDLSFILNSKIDLFGKIDFYDCNENLCSLGPQSFLELFGIHVYDRNISSDSSIIYMEVRTVIFFFLWYCYSLYAEGISPD